MGSARRSRISRTGLLAILCSPGRRPQPDTERGPVEVEKWYVKSFRADEDSLAGVFAKAASDSDKGSPCRPQNCLLTWIGQNVILRTRGSRLVGHGHKGRGRAHEHEVPIHDPAVRDRGQHSSGRSLPAACPQRPEIPCAVEKRVGPPPQSAAPRCPRTCLGSLASINEPRVSCPSLPSPECHQPLGLKHTGQTPEHMVRGTGRTE